MLFGKSTLLEIMAIVQEALGGFRDASQSLREIDVIERDGVLELSPEYVAAHSRSPIWEENN
jgi:hypothetical protein